MNNIHPANHVGDLFLSMRADNNPRIGHIYALQSDQLNHMNELCESDATYVEVHDSSSNQRKYVIKTFCEPARVKDMLALAIKRGIDVFISFERIPDMKDPVLKTQWQKLFMFLVINQHTTPVQLFTVENESAPITLSHRLATFF